jgi:hypothetical protein
MGEGHAPVVAVLVASAKADESIAAPKGHGPLDPAGFFLQTGCFQGTAGRGHDRLLGPLASRRRDGRRGPCPRCGSPSSGRKKRQTSPSLPPKGTDPWTLRAFSCKQAVFRGPPEGAMIAIVDPEPSRRRGGGRRPCPPLWQYLSRLQKKARRVHRCPQRGGFTDPRPFPLQTRCFLGVHEGGHDAVRGPL